MRKEQQVIDTGVPVIVALNMSDEAEKEGLKIDHQILSELLGVPVIPTVAIKKKGLDDLKANLYQARPGLSIQIFRNNWIKSISKSAAVKRC